MLFRRGYNFEFPWVLIFVGAVFRVYLKSRFLFKVIMETTRISSVIRISSVFSHHEIYLARAATNLNGGYFLQK